MAKTKLEIANKALALLGARRITSFIEADSNEADAINEVYVDIVDEVLAEYPWGFAQKRVELEYVVPDDVSRTINGRILIPVTITGATAAEPVVITAADHGLENGERIKIVGVVGMTQLNGNFYRIANKTVDTFELINEDTEEDIDGDAYTAYVSGGTIQLANDSNPVPITAVTAATPPVVTSAAHGLSDGDWIKIVGVTGMTQLNGNFYIVDDATTNTFSLDDTDAADVVGAAYTAYVSGGQIIEAPELVVVDTGEAVVYQKPDDLIKPIKKNIKWANLRIERDKIISDNEGLKLIYTFRNEDVTQYYPKFVQALATRLAAEIAFRVINSVSKSEAMLKNYHEIALPSAVAVDTTAGTPDEMVGDQWLESMMHGSGHWPATYGSGVWHAA